ncbi:MAG TPA: PLD nuclease N-terminal domain-containing protein [Planctomycetaceae bacterium]|nr:PLD nuclease N-terminal domain-containing protein [Planctomycetaceae bacterium]
MTQLLAQNDGLGGLLVGGGILIVWVLFVIAGLVLLIWALVDAIKNPNLSDTQRIIWVLVILFVGCIGPVLYLLVGRNTAPPPTHTGGGPTP